jgi:hypothetical protein
MEIVVDDLHALDGEADSDPLSARGRRGLIPWTSCAPFHQVVHLAARGGRRLDALHEGASRHP